MDDPLALLEGGRVDGAFVTPETGLVGLTVWCPGGARRLRIVAVTHGEAPTAGEAAEAFLVRLLGGSPVAEGAGP